ncbi:MAG: NAD(P)H-dependent oxidoreductase subunit E [Planctomycetota bacterium]
MAWLAEDKRAALTDAGEPLLTEKLKSKLRDTYFPRYPTKKACLLPGLHLLQHEYGWIPPQAMSEIAEFLEISEGEVIDTASFYEEYWLQPKGKYLLQVCRSLACEICRSAELTSHIEEKLNVESGETSDDQRFTLVELECLGSCGTAPVLMINDVLHENVDVEKVDQLIADLPDDPHAHQDPTVDWDAGH